MEKILVTKSSMPSLDEYVEQIRPLWDSHWLTNHGSLYMELVDKLKTYLNVPNIELLVNGHMALEMTLQAMHLSGEVITTPFSFASTTHAISRNGLTPVFCDIKEFDGTIDEDLIESLITERTTAILPVHVYGNLCNVKKIEEIAKKHGLKVIYDAAHAFGVEYQNVGVGNFGDASMFSFHATKVYNTIEGGAVCFGNSALGDEILSLSNFGIRTEEIVDGIGGNAKMNEFQAAMGLCNLRHVDDEIAKRKHVVKLYKEMLKDVEGITYFEEQKDVKSNYAYFPILVHKELYGMDRDALVEALKEHNIYSRKYFYPIISDYDCYKDIYDSSDTPVAKRISDMVITLPLFADLEDMQVERICTIIRNLKK